MQQTPDDSTPFLQRGGARPPRTQRLEGKRLGLVSLGLAGGLLVFVFVTLQARQHARQTPQAAPLPGLHEVSGRPVTSGDIQLKDSYEGLDRSPPKLPAPPPPIPRPEPLPAPVQPPVVAQQLPSPWTPPATPPPQLPVVEQQAPAPLAAPPQRPAPVQRIEAPKEKPRRWLFVPTQSMGKSPFGDDPKDKGDSTPGGPGTPPGTEKGGLIHQATWEKPADVTRTWYRSQGVQGLTTTEIVSDIQGPVVIRVTRALEDKFLQGQVLIPQHSLIIASQAGNPQFGASRLAVQLDQVELPDGAILSLKAKLSDAQGAQGLHGSTNYHWGRVLAGAGLSALLSIGTRLPAGNQEGFAPTIGQEASRDVSGSVARTGNQLVSRELTLAPTITIPPGTPVTIFPQDNISLSHAPKTIK